MDARELDDTILSRIPEESSTTKCNCWLVGWQLGKRPQSSPVIIYIAHKFNLGDVNKTIIGFGSTTKYVIADLWVGNRAKGHTVLL